MKLLVVSLLLLFALPVMSQSAGQIAIVDGEKVLRDSEPGKKLFAEVKTLRDKKQQEIEQRQTSIQVMQEKLNKEIVVSNNRFCAAPLKFHDET